MTYNHPLWPEAVPNLSGGASELNILVINDTLLVLNTMLVLHKLAIWNMGLWIDSFDKHNSHSFQFVHKCKILFEVITCLDHIQPIHQRTFLSHLVQSLDSLEFFFSSSCTSSNETPNKIRNAPVSHWHDNLSPKIKMEKKAVITFFRDEIWFF